MLVARNSNGSPLKSSKDKYRGKFMNFSHADGRTFLFRRSLNEN